MGLYQLTFSLRLRRRYHLSLPLQDLDLQLK